MDSVSNYYIDESHDLCLDAVAPVHTCICSVHYVITDHLSPEGQLSLQWGQVGEESIIFKQEVQMMTKERHILA